MQDKKVTIARVEYGSAAGAIKVILSDGSELVNLYDVKVQGSVNDLSRVEILMFL